MSCRASVTTFTRSNQGFGEEEGLATGGVPMQAGMDEGAHMDHGGGRQHAEMLGAAGILHKPEEEGLNPQVQLPSRTSLSWADITYSLV